MNRKKSLCFFALLLLFAVTNWQCSGDDPLSPQARFPLAEPLAFDMEKLAMAFDKAAETEGLESLLVSRNGVLVGEAYFHDQGPARLVHVRSVTKSVMALLIGIAIEQGAIASVEQPLSVLLGGVVETLSPEKGQITLRHVLTMSAGLQWNEAGVTEFNNWILSADHIDYVLSRPLVDEPGQRFNYNSATSHLLSVILTEASGMSTPTFARRFLFEPMGIDSVRWQLLSRGYYNGGAGLEIRPRDLEKIGRLMMNRGVFSGRQIVPAAWIDACTSAHIVTSSSARFGTAYGYQWWIGSQHGHDLYFANGYGGQFIVNVPALRLTLVATSAWQGLGDRANSQWFNVLSLLMNDLIPAAREQH